MGAFLFAKDTPDDSFVDALTSIDADVDVDVDVDIDADAEIFVLLLDDTNNNDGNDIRVVNREWG